MQFLFFFFFHSTSRTTSQLRQECMLWGCTQPWQLQTSAHLGVCFEHLDGEFNYGFWKDIETKNTTTMPRHTSPYTVCFPYGCASPAEDRPLSFWVCHRTLIVEKVALHYYSLLECLRGECGWVGYMLIHPNNLKGSAHIYRMGEKNVLHSSS